MEPASPSVALLGVAGSFASLAGVVIESRKTIHKVWHSLKAAPQDVGSLFRKLRRLEAVTRLPTVHRGGSIEQESFQDSCEKGPPNRPARVTSFLANDRRPITASASRK